MVLRQNPRKAPRKRMTVGAIPPLPREARLPMGMEQDAAAWLDQYVGYARQVSPLTPDLFHEAGGLWLVSLGIARRLVLRLAHKDVFPNLAVLQIAPTTIYAKSTGLNIPRHLAQLVMRHLLLPGEMTPEAMIDELAGKEPAMFTGIDMEEWQKGRSFAGQRGVCLDEASSLFVGMSKDYNIGMSETLLRLYDCDPWLSRQTRGTGRATVRDAYWTFLGATTPWHMRRADVDSLWYTGLWPRFLLITPDAAPTWEQPRRQRSAIPSGIVERLQTLTTEALPEPSYQESVSPVDMGLGEGVFDAYTAYFKALMHDLIVPPTPVDLRLFGVYGKLPEQALKIAMLLASLGWNGNGAPVIGMNHWAWAQAFAEKCRASAHRLPGLLAEQSQNEDESRVIMFLDASETEWVTARDIYRALNMKSATVKLTLLDLMEANMVQSREEGRATFYRLRREEDDEPGQQN